MRLWELQNFQWFSDTELHQFDDAASKADWKVVDRGYAITFFKPWDNTGKFPVLWSDTVVKVELKEAWMLVQKKEPATFE